jgi:predicted nucleotidyltransferase
VGEILERRRKETAERIKKLRGRLDDADKYCVDKACVYVTGSYGRNETSQFSDLDLFIAGHGTADKPELSRLTKSW